MNKTLLLPLFMAFTLSHFGLKAQNNVEIKCNMTVEEILLQQPFDIDDAKSEDARNISLALIAELKEVCKKVNENAKEGFEPHFQLITSLVDSAIKIGMNYEMFVKDLEYIETLK